MKASTRTRVLVCEDSATYAHALTRLLQADPELEVVGVCRSGEDALEALGRLSADLVTMDLELPGMGGVRAVEEIMQRHPVPILVLSGHAGRGSDLAAHALAAGALEVLSKDHLRLQDPDGLSATAVRQKLRRLARASVGHAEQPETAAPAHPARRAATTVVGVCSSTGGPRALEAVLTRLPADFAVPVVVVQHIAAGFIDGLIRWLDGCVLADVGLARDGQQLGPGIWFAPDDAHLRVDPAMRFSVDHDTDAGPHRPSADVLLTSMAAAAGAGAVGVVLTGMGRDGAEGVGALRRSGGYAIAQDEASSAVFGMPKAAAAAGADRVMALSQIGGALASLAPLEART